MTRIGYTGHEHWDELGLINMTGRMYDPLLGRFLSPDPYIQMGGNTQNLNRYSYCINNPLIYTDPSGEFMGLAVFGATFLTQWAENVINGVDNPAQEAYNFSTSVVNNINNAFQIPIYNKNNATISAGLSPLSMGVSTNITYTSGAMTYSGSGGIGVFGFFGSGGASYSSCGNTFGVSVGAGDNHIGVGASFTRHGYGIGYTFTNYGNEIGPDGLPNSQNVGGVNIYLNDWSVRLENDFLANDGDRWRSNALEISYKEFSVGTYLYNNDPEGTYGSGAYSLDKESPKWGTNRAPKGGWDNGYTYTAPLYLGYRVGNSVSRMGYSHEVFQDYTQNWVHKWVPFGRQHYYADYDQHFNREIYLFQGWSNSFSLWGR